MADIESSKSLNGLLNGIAQKFYYNNSEITEDLLKNELYPDLSQEEFHALHEKMKGLLKSIASADMDQAQLEAFLTAQTRKQGGGGERRAGGGPVQVLEEPAGPGSREPSGPEPLGTGAPGPELEGGSADLGQQRGAGQRPVAMVELELGRTGEESEFVCMEFDEVKVNQVLKKMAEIQESIDSIVHRG